MERRIFGLENEYGVTCTLRGQRRLSPDEVARYLFRRVVSWGRSSNVFLENGAKIEAAILAGIAGSEAKLVALEKAAKALPTKSPTAFQKGAAKLSDGLATFSQPFQKGLSKAESLDKSGDLNAALGSQPSCADLEQFVTGG